MTCGLCERVALYVVGTQAYCKRHHEEARDAAHQQMIVMESKFGARTGDVWNSSSSGRHQRADQLRSATKGWR